MKKKVERSVIVNYVAMFGGVTLNFALSYLSYKADLPMYFDSIGTIGVAAVCGMLP